MKMRFFHLSPRDKQLLQLRRAHSRAGSDQQPMPSQASPSSSHSITKPSNN